MKDAASFVVVGHVDHGKSTLIGHLCTISRLLIRRQLRSCAGI